MRDAVGLIKQRVYLNNKPPSFYLRRVFSGESFANCRMTRLSLRPIHLQAVPVALPVPPLFSRLSLIYSSYRQGYQGPS